MVPQNLGDEGEAEVCVGEGVGAPVGRLRPEGGRLVAEGDAAGAAAALVAASLRASARVDAMSSPNPGPRSRELLKELSRVLSAKDTRLAVALELRLLCVEDE